MPLGRRIIVFSLSAAALFAAAVSFFYFSDRSVHYYIYSGFDFATGESFTAKGFAEAERGEYLWIKRGAGDAALFAFFGIGDEQTLLQVGGARSYNFLGRDCGERGDFHSPCFRFLRFLRYARAARIPESEVRRIYRKCILFLVDGTDRNVVNKYLDREFGRFGADAL